MTKERKAVRDIEGRLITASLKVKSLKEELKNPNLKLQVLKKVDALQKKCSRLMLKSPKKVTSENSVAYASLELELSKLKTEVDGLEAKNAKLVAEKGKFNQIVTSLQAKNSVLRAENQ